MNIHTHPVPHRRSRRPGPLPADVDGYRPGLDGIRALAVIAVLAFHLDRLPGGNLGVDAFFVLSGWLITWKALQEADRDGTIDLRRFWAARARRIIPAAMAVLITVAVVWPLAGINVPSLRRDVAWAAAWMSNWATISSGDSYWARFGDLSPVTHFWSLAIEEQFYLFWPLVLILVIGRTRRHRLTVGVVSATAALASIVAMNLMFNPNDPTATYMNTFARAHNLLIGATVAAFTTVLADGSLRGGPTARRFAPVGAAVAVTIVALSSEATTWLFRWGFPLFAAAMATVVVAAADGAGRAALTSAPLRWVGERSYGLYLWHWPVFLFLSSARLGVPDGAMADAIVDLLRVSVAVVLAALSYRFLEQPIRQRRRLQQWRGPAAAGLTFAVLALVLAFIRPPTATSETSVVTLPPPASTTAEVAISVHTADEQTAPGDAEPRAPVSSSVPTDDADTANAPASSLPLADLAPVRVLVTGDSTGLNMADALIKYADGAQDELIVGSAAAGGCGLTVAADGRLHEFTNADGQRERIDLRGCLTQWESVPRRVVEEAIDVVLVTIGPWDVVDIRLPDGSMTSVGDPIGALLVAEAYEGFAEQMRSTGTTLVWVRPADTHLGWGSFDDPVNEPERWTALRAIIDGLDVVHLDLAGWLVAEGIDGPDARPDGVHLTESVNELFVTEQVAPVLAQLRTGLGVAVSSPNSSTPADG